MDNDSQRDEAWRTFAGAGVIATIAAGSVAFHTSSSRVGAASFPIVLAMLLILVMIERNSKTNNAE